MKWLSKTMKSLKLMFCYLMLSIYWKDIKFYVNMVKYTLRSTESKIKIPMTRKWIPIVLQWDLEHIVLFIEQELVKRHQEVSHCLDNTLTCYRNHHDILETTLESRKILQEISKPCKIGQGSGLTPTRLTDFTFSRASIVFGKKEVLDLMVMNADTVQHIVESATQCSAATFLEAHGTNFGRDVEGISPAFAGVWSLKYVRLPNRLCWIKECITSERWKSVAANPGAEMHLSGVKDLGWLGINGKLNKHLKGIFKKLELIFQSYPKMPSWKLWQKQWRKRWMKTHWSLLHFFSE